MEEAQRQGPVGSLTCVSACDLWRGACDHAACVCVCVLCVCACACGGGRAVRVAGIVWGGAWQRVLSLASVPTTAHLHRLHSLVAAGCHTRVSLLQTPVPS
jgi:hypothetical protein